MRNTVLYNLRGYMLAALAAAAYGTNPAFAIPLYDAGMNPNTVLLFRYILGIPFVAAMMMIRGKSFKINWSATPQVFLLGILMALSSLTLFESYQYMNSGIASTLLFIYPILVALIMITRFHEKFRISLILCLLIMIIGLILLMNNTGPVSISFYGFFLVMMSALTYALYIVLVNVSKTVSKIPTTKLLFYVLISGSLVFIVKISAGTEMTMPANGDEWINLLALAIIPTVISLACTSAAIHIIGSTPTAIFGALEPVTAVILSVILLGQPITLKEIAGGCLIILATLVVIAGKQIDRIILSVRKMFPIHHSAH